jgi:hypothetical protein
LNKGLGSKALKLLKKLRKLVRLRTIARIRDLSSSCASKLGALKLSVTPISADRGGGSLPAARLGSW